MILSSPTVLGNGFSHFAEAVIPQLIALLPNSAKIMASSAEVCVRFIIKVCPRANAWVGLIVIFLHDDQYQPSVTTRSVKLHILTDLYNL